MSPFVVLNDRPYGDGQEDPCESLRDTLAFSVDDWGSSRAMAWTWGIVNGWDSDAMAELAEKFRWDAATTARLDRLHTGFDALRSTPAAPDPVADVLLVRERDQPQPDAVLREALTDIRDTTLDQPAAVNVPDEDWYRRLLLRAMGIARAALRSTPAAPHQHRFDVVIRDDEHMRLLGCSNTPCEEAYQWDR